MGKEVIMLANPYKPKMLNFPVVVTEKLDGVAADLYASSFGYVNARTRQDEPSNAISHIQNWLEKKLPYRHHAICELYIEGLPFKEISGISRRSETDDRLVAYIYDYYVDGKEDIDYSDRITLMVQTLGKYISKTTPVRTIPAKRCANQDELDKYLAEFKSKNPNAEGVVIRSLHGSHSHYKFGRSHGMMKLKNKGTADLRVHSFQEAVSKDTGEGLGMVGRINVEYETEVADVHGKMHKQTIIIGAGAGSMKHDERKEVWDNQHRYIGRIGEFAYMPDKSYEALREARFKHWRDDKTEPNQEDL